MNVQVEERPVEENEINEDGDDIPSEIIEDESDDKPIKNKKNYVLTESRKIALQKAREKKTDYAKAGKELVKKGKKIVEEKTEEIIPKRTIKKEIQPQQIQDDEEEMYQSHQRLKEDEIREYLKYKKQEEDEYRRTLMIKSQIEKEQKYKKAFASIFGN